MKVTVVLGVLLAAGLLAGCLDRGEDPGPELPVHVRPSLVDFEVCEFRYLDDNATAVPCENTIETLEIQPERPTTVPSLWFCTNRGGSERPDATEYWLHWHPLEERYGLYYEVRGGAQYPISGHLYNAETGWAVAWYGGGDTGFVEFDDPGTETLRLRLFSHGYESPTEGLAGGEIRAHWSMHNGVPYPLQVLTAPSGTYYFHNVTGGLETEDFYRYEVQPFKMVGEDFEITVHATRHHDMGTVMLTTPRAGCATGVPP